MTGDEDTEAIQTLRDDEYETNWQSLMNQEPEPKPDDELSDWDIFETFLR